MTKQFINRLEEGIISFLLAIMTLLVFAEVLLRFGVGYGPVREFISGSPLHSLLMWAEEATLLLGAWMVLFGASYGIKVGSHIGVDAAVRLMPDKTRRVVSVIAVCLCLVYCGLYIYGAWFYLEKMHLIGIELEDLPIPRWIAHSILFFGMILLAVRLLDLLVRIVQGKADGFKLADEAKESMHLAEEAKRGAQMADEAVAGTPLESTQGPAFQGGPVEGKPAMDAMKKDGGDQ